MFGGKIIRGKKIFTAEKEFTLKKFLSSQDYLILPPPIFLKLSELKDSCMKRYPSPKLAARMHYSYLKTALKIKHKCKNTKI